MDFDTHFGVENKRLLDLNSFIHRGTELFEYHMNHIYLTRNYATLLSHKLNANIDIKKLEYISLAHDLFKERSLGKKKTFVNWDGFQVPLDINRYVRLNLDVLEKYGMDMYFNTDVQLHSLTAGIFLVKEFGITDPSVIYPIMFHSCPIIPVYETLDTRIQEIVDIIMLADKLSSNYLKINYRDMRARVDLDKIVFGVSGNEFNYTLGLYISRLLAQGASKEEQSVLSTQYYHKRLSEVNPLISRNYSVRRLGGYVAWPLRKSSQVWKMQ